MEKIYRKKFKLKQLPFRCEPDSIYYIRETPTSKVFVYVTDNIGIPSELKDESGSGGIQNIQNTDGNLTISGSLTKNIDLQTSFVSTVNSALQPNDNISNLNNDVGYISFLEKESAENIPSHTPITIINNKAYKLNNLNNTHLFSFAGFSVNGTVTGEVCKIQQIGEIVLQGWNLIPNTQYLAGENGTIQIQNNGEGFTKVIGYATTSNSMQIIKDYTTIIK